MKPILRRLLPAPCALAACALAACALTACALAGCASEHELAKCDGPLQAVDPNDWQPTVAELADIAARQPKP